jgi:hypothetical protein
MRLACTTARAAVLAGVLALVLGSAVASGGSIPAFGRDTVLVWTVKNQEDSTTFVVRIAEFLPSRYIEWENTTTQGTIRMSPSAVAGAKGFTSARLFEGGVDTRGKDSTTLWLSEWAYRELKS